MDDEKKDVVPEKFDVSKTWGEILEREELKGLADGIPKLFAALAEEYQKHRNVEIRKRIKSNFNALMTIISTDTEYNEPPVSSKMKTTSGIAVDNTFV